MCNVINLMTLSTQWRHCFLLKLSLNFSKKQTWTETLDKRTRKIYKPNSFLNELKNYIKKQTKVAVAMATREMAITPPIFNREIKYFAQICTILCTIILHPYFGFLLVQTRNNKNHELSHFPQNSLFCRGKWIFKLKTIVKVYSTLCFGQSN